MPIRRGRLADIQAQQVEVGRIRLGTSNMVSTRSGGQRPDPVKLETFRLTSRSQDLIAEAAELFGGQVQPWQPHSGGAQQWQVFTERRSIEVIVPPDPVSQFYEVWSGGRCQRRCDGLRELISDQGCLCGPDPSQRRCKPTTRLSLMLAEMSGIGVWRLETHGYYAAAELPAVADLLSAAGGNVPARLEMEERQAMVPDPRDASKEIQTRFMVPVLHVQATPARLLAIFGSDGQPALPTIPERAALPAGTNGPQPTGPAEPAAPLDPDQELMRQRWVIHTRFEDEIIQATSADRLAAIGRAIRQSGLPGQFMDSLRIQYQDRMSALNSVDGAADQPVPAPQPPAPAQVPAQDGAGRVDRVAEFTAIQTTAAQQGMGMSALRQAFGEFTNGQRLDGATGEQLAEFHTYLRGS